MKQLPPKQYEVIKLFVKGLTTAEIAARFRTTANNVSKLKKRAFNSIRSRYLQQSKSK